VILRRHESLFTMSALNGLVAIRRYSSQFPGIAVPEAITAMRRVSPDDAYHDYEAALALQEFIPFGESTHVEIPTFFRDTLTVLIEKTQPWWIRLAPMGRERVHSALSPNEAQCLEAAGLFPEIPSLEIRQWWDRLSQVVRASTDSKHLEQGRVAEQLTLDYETRRLEALGISNRPRWISIDNNTAGYDVQSFDQGVVDPISKLIEVKSCARSDVEIFITRNEWETAIERAPHYHFHIWILPENDLIELTPQEIAPHIPQDRGDGRWQDTKIALRLP
jgi:hypothetical protein